MTQGLCGICLDISDKQDSNKRGFCKTLLKMQSSKHVCNAHVLRKREWPEHQLAYLAKIRLHKTRTPVQPLKPCPNILTSGLCNVNPGCGTVVKCTCMCMFAL